MFVLSWSKQVIDLPGLRFGSFAETAIETGLRSKSVPSYLINQFIMILNIILLDQMEEKEK